MSLATKLSLPLLALVLVTAPSIARAATWVEISDAGPAPVNAQPTVGTGPLTQIQGTFLSDYDIDMYCIQIDDYQNFRAIRNCLAIIEPDLWLFDANGIGIELNDSCMGGQTNLVPGFVPSNGFYFLAISSSDQDALNAGNLPIWNPPFVSGARAPDGTGAPGPFASWGGTPASLQGNLNYSIQIQGATFCESPVPARSATWGEVKARFSGQ